VLTLADRDAHAGVSLAGEMALRHGTAPSSSGSRRRGVAAGGLGAGAHGVLCKPVHREQLEATFRLAIDQHVVAGRASRHADEARARLLEVRCTASPGAGPARSRDGRRRRRGRADLRTAPREQEVVRLLLQHLRVPAIARRLGISQQTVRNH
jgi:DNA-binding NarL/FixJ family response regulator